MRRRGLPVLAALAAVLTLAGCGLVTGQHAAPASIPPSARAAAATEGVPVSIRVHGVTIPFDRAQRWTQASIESRSSRTLQVFVVGSEQGGDQCGPPVVRLHVTETATTVRVLAADYEQPATPEMMCPAIGYLAGPDAVRLSRPLGSRPVVDASTGRTAALLDGSQHPTLPTAPTGLTAGVLMQQPHQATVLRIWSPHGRGDPGVELSDQPPASLRTVGPYGRVALQTEVHGTPATVYQATGIGSNAWFVQWTPNPKQTITLSTGPGGGHHWTAASTLALARSVTNYRIESTGRLGEPSVPGTVAATYSSADGPLVNAENLLKSSGVYVGLDCVGAGRLTVVIRGRATSFTCTGTTTHHGFESEGAPNEAFTTSVLAGAHVRWVLSLARASLDGS